MQNSFNDPGGDGPDVLLGLIAPALGAAFGTWIIVRGHITIPAKGARVEFVGWDAVAWGVLAIGLSAAAHVRYHWKRSNRLARYAELATAASMLAVIASAAFLFWRTFANFAG
jgi:hypothetical protein